MPNTIDAVALVYARALFELADGAGGRAKLEEIGDELEQVMELIRSDRRFREFVASPIVDRVKRSDALRSIFHGRVTDLLLRFLLVLNRKDRLGHIESIAQAFDGMIQASFGNIEVDVFTATPIDGGQLEVIKGLVRRALGKEPVLHRYVEPSMLGGIKLRIGDSLIDGSVEGRLQRMKSAILASGASSLRDQITKVIQP